MSAKEIRALERLFFSECNKGKATAVTVIDKLCATNWLSHRETGEDIQGLENVKKHMNMVFNAFPDAHWTIDDIIVEGNKAVVRYTFTGTHKGKYMDATPTNKKVTLSAITIDRFAHAKMVESWESTDTLSFMQQLGLIPTPNK